ncbi:FadR/GntR family transcriptional regulator [Romboutsia lituseburensis]|uniref:FadR/GntR family transcriptional regulator n=1 Tax=Romboutsia lituseburensis TaxID=1537 RepID=UPI00215A606C|nr:FadR family transcriptional regulator [Romboutsia lituseburensis]MCR8745278.1 FadR family transcriptional regulator [Romboutsia lituseburensis]
MFNSISSKKVYEQVIEQIQESILSGELKKGDKLPSERELSDRMRVSRTSIREALRVLETMGVVESRQGEGNFICTNIEKSLIEPLSMIFKLNDGTWQNVLELREMLELQTVKIAAIRSTKEDCIELKAIVDGMKKETQQSSNKKEIVRLDQKFHKKLVSMSKNYLIESLFVTSSKLFEGFIKDAREKIIATSWTKEVLVDKHDAIYEAISSKNPDEAYNKMKEHMDIIRKSYEEMNNTENC